MLGGGSEIILKKPDRESTAGFYEIHIEAILLAEVDHRFG